MENTKLTTTASGDRILSIDALRGFIMMLMALDHANSFLSFGSSSEFWGGAIRQFETSADFLVRFITHLCAPGFFFLMGISMIYLAASRRQKNWTEHQIRHYFFVRGAVIIFIHFALSLITAAPRLVQGNFGIVFNVLFILGLSMQVGALLIHATPSMLAALLVISFTIPQLLLGRFVEFGQPIHPILQLMFAPGPMGPHTVYYTLFSWIGFCFAGLLFGKFLYRNRSDTISRIPFISAAALILFIILRFIGGFGNLRPAVDSTWISFLSLTKYPPSIVFALLMLSLNLMILYFFEKISPYIAKYGQVLLVFGRSALFFYVIHHFIYIAMMIAGLRNLPLSTMWIFWLIGLAVAYPLCIRYSSFKRRQPSESLWRML